jgi:MATE family multidrug resistance protein
LIFGKLGFEPLGIKGAAIASISGSFGAVVMLLFAYFGKSNRIAFQVMTSFKLDFKIIKRLLHFGYPAGVELFLNFLAFFVIISLFHSRGHEAATASTIMFNWDLVSFIPLLGIEIAVTSLVGRYIGAQRPQVAHRAAISAVKSGIFYSVVILILFVFIPETLVMVFKPNEMTDVFLNSVPIAVNMIRIAAFYVLAEAIMVALVGALRGAGDTHFTMIISVAAHWILIPVLYLSLKILNLSIEISWSILVVFYLLFGLILYLRFKSGKWKKINVIGE